MEKYLVPLATPCVYFDDSFLRQEEADAAYQELLKSTKWETSAKINRFVALYEEEIPIGGRMSDEPAAGRYQYRDAPSSQEAAKSSAFTPLIRSLCERAERWYNGKTTNHDNEKSAEVRFNVCLLNFYENGQQRIGWHTDREEIGRTTPIASISLGATREFQLRAQSGGERTSLSLTHGSLVVMENACQLNYVHCIPKMNAVTEGRINLTFRCKTEDTPGEEEHQRRDKWLERITDLHDGVEFGHSFPNYCSSADQKEANYCPVFGDILETTDELESKLQAMTVLYTVKTNIGAEGYTTNELENLFSNQHHDNKWVIVPRPWGVAGYVAVGRIQQDSDSDKSTEVVASLQTLRSAFHVMRYHDHFDLSDVAAKCSKPMPEIDGEDLYQFYKQRLVDGIASIPTLLTGTKKQKTTFRVTCERIGDHINFQAPNVEFEVGGAMSEFYAHAKPKMEDFDVNIRVDVVGQGVVIGTQLNFVELSKRHFYRYRNKVTIKASLAYVMLKCANLQANQVVLDPFCGSGTILLEAVDLEPSVRCIGLDVNRKSIQGALDNAKAASVHNTCKFHCTDVRALRKHVADQSVDCIVSNLPWGVQTGQKKSVADLQSLYEQFLRTSWYILKEEGRIVMLVLRGLQLTRILRKLGGRYRILRANVVRTTNNLPCLVVVEKVSRDVLNDTIKGQLSYMAQYVNISREIYHAIQNEDIASGIEPAQNENTSWRA